MQDKDVDAAVELTDDPCVVTGAQGVGRVDRASFKGMMENASWSIVDYRMGDDVEVLVLGDDTAVVAYTVHEDLTVDGTPVSFDAAETSTWVRRDGRWVCAAHTEAITGDPYGRDRAGTT
jgi:ketosteroid isomerase-like protein